MPEIRETDLKALQRELERRQQRAKENADRREKQVTQPSSSAAVYMPSPHLAAVIGSRNLSQREVSRRISAYITNNRLLRVNRDGCTIKTDARLAALCKVRPGNEVKEEDFRAHVGEHLVQDAFAEARRRVSQETSRRHAREERDARRQEQEKRAEKMERRRAEAQAKQRKAFEEHQQRVEEMFHQLQGK
jgi:chromatin remodeling complex protein RSC6